MQLIDLRNIRPRQEPTMQRFLIGFYRGKPIVWEKRTGKEPTT